MSAPVINPFAVSDLLSVRSGIVAMRLTRRKARLRTEIRSDCGPLDEGPSRWCLCIVNNIRYSLPPWARWNRVQHSPSLVQACVEAVQRRKKWGNSWTFLFCCATCRTWRAPPLHAPPRSTVHAPPCLPPKGGCILDQSRESEIQFPVRRPNYEMIQTRIRSAGEHEFAFCGPQEGTSCAATLLATERVQSRHRRNDRKSRQDGLPRRRVVRLGRLL